MLGAHCQIDGGVILILLIIFVFLVLQLQDGAQVVGGDNGLFSVAAALFFVFDGQSRARNVHNAGDQRFNFLLLLRKVPVAGDKRFLKSPFLLHNGCMLFSIE